MPSKMPYGMGSISGPDATGRYQVRISLGRDEDGKRRRVIVRADSKAEAKIELDKLRDTYGKTKRSGAPMRMGAYFDSWLARKEAELEPKSIRSYRSGVDNLKPLLGHFRIDQLEPQHIATAFRTMRDRNKGERTIQSAYDTLRAALNFAIRRDQILAANPLLAVPRPRIHREIDFLTREEAQAFLAAVADDRYRALWHLVIATGLRWGELAGLRWSDVDLDAGALTVQRALKETRDTGRTKTAGSRRRVDLPPSIVVELREHKERQRPKGCTIVFASAIGTPMHASNIERRNFFPALERAKLRRIRFHDLRHTAAAIRLLAGQHPKIVAEMLGHSSIRTTLDVYGHLQASVSKDAALGYDRAMALVPKA